MYNFKQYNESLSNVLSGVKQFVEKANNDKMFIDNLIYVCNYLDIALSTLTGQYLGYTKAKKLSEDEANYIIFWFSIEYGFNGYTWRQDGIRNKYDSFKSEDDNYDDIIQGSDYAIVIDPKKQTSLSSVRKKREENKEGAIKLISDYTFRTDNLKRYKSEIDKKREPRMIAMMVDAIKQSKSFDVNILKTIGGVMKKSLYRKLLDTLYELELIKSQDYLSCLYECGRYDLY